MNLSNRSFWIFLLVCCCPAFVQAQSDDCMAPLPTLSLGANAFDTTGFTDSVEADPTGCTNSYGAGANDGWFSFTAPSSGLLTIDSCQAGSYDTSLAFYEGGCGVFDPLSAVACDGDGGDGGVVPGCQDFGSFVQGLVTAGVEYTVRISGFGATDAGAGMLNLSIGAAPTAPANDNCADAITVAEGSTTAWSTLNGTDEGTFACRGLDDVWFEITPSADGLLTAALENLSNAAGFGTDTNHSIYLNSTPGSCPTDADNIVCSDPTTGSAMVTAGQSYLIRIGAWSTGGVNQYNGDLTVTLQIAAPEICDNGIDDDLDGDTDCDDTDCAADLACAPPVNDNCSGAITLLENTTSAWSSANATNEAPALACRGTNDVWFEFTPSVDGILDVDLTNVLATDGSGSDTNHSLYLNSTPGSCPVDADELVCSDPASFTTTVTAAQSYLIRVGAWSTSATADTYDGDITVTLTVPGDECAAAFTVVEGANAFDNTGFSDSAEPNPTGCANSFGANAGDIWFSYTPAADGFASFDTCLAGSFDTDLTVYDGSCGALNLLGCDGDGGDAGVIAGCQDFGSAVFDVFVAGGTEYLVRVGGFNAGEFGAGSLNIAFAPLPVRINEVRTDHGGADTEEYFELAGTPGTDLTGLTYITIGDGAGGSGVIENVTDLTGLAIGPGGHFFAATSDFGTVVTSGNTPDLVTGLAFENSDNLTHFLVEGFTGASGDDLDTDDDGILDVTPWTAIVDEVAQLETTDIPASGEFVYSTVTVGPDGTFVPGTFKRCDDYFGDFRSGPFEIDPTLGGEDSPGDTNICPAANNDCDNAVPVSVGDVVAFDTTDTTTDGLALDPLVCDLGTFGDEQIYQDIWFLLTADCDASIIIDLSGSLYDTRLAVYNQDVCPDDPANVIACDDDGGTGLDSRLTVDVVGGTTYLVRVGGFDVGDEGIGTMAITLGNDSCADALPIVDGDNPFCTLGATTDGLELDPLVCDPGTFGDDQIYNDVWFTWTASGTGEFIMSTCGQVDYDTRLAVYSSTACPDDPANVIACNDDGANCLGLESELTFMATLGDTYLVRIGGFNPAESGTGVLTVVSACDPVVLADLTAMPDNGNAPATIVLAATATGTDPVTWAWDSGDGQMSADPDTATFTYATPGTYTASVTVTNDCGTDTLTIDVTVCESLTVDFSFTNTGLAEACADFTDLTTGDIASYDWDLGNGSTSTDPNPSTTYPMAGDYTVTLTVTGVCGRVESAMQSLTVLAVGDCNGDGSVDIADPMFLGSYLFGGGPAPSCLAACEVNGDDATDLGDVVYSLNTLFSSGPAPVAPAACTPCN